MENPTDKEREVALILQSLPKLILQSPQSRRGRSHLPRWANKKTRTRRIHRSEKLLSSEGLHSSPVPPSVTNLHAVDLSLSADTEKLTRVSSPASPLHFYPSGDDTGNKPAATAAAETSASRPAKKIKLKSKELVNEHTNLVRSLSEINKLLEQEKAGYTKHHEKLLEENSRLKMMLSKSKTTSVHPQLLQPGTHELRTYSTPLDPGGPTVRQSPDRLLPYGERKAALAKTAAGHSPPPQPPTPAVEDKPLSRHAAATSVVQHGFNPTPVQFWGFGGGCIRFIDPIAQLAPGRLGSFDAEMVVAARSQPSDAKKKATAKARKRRMEIYRMKSTGAATTGASFGNAAKVR